LFGVVFGGVYSQNIGALGVVHVFWVVKVFVVEFRNRYFVELFFGCLYFILVEDVYMVGMVL